MSVVLINVRFLFANTALNLHTVRTKETNNTAATIDAQMLTVLNHQLLEKILIKLFLT